MATKLPVRPASFLYEGFLFKRSPISGNKYVLEVFAGNNRIFKSVPLGESSSRAIFVSDEFKDKMLKVLRSEYRKSKGRVKNPTTGVVSKGIVSKGQIDTGPLGMPADPDEAYALGRIAGINYGLHLCEHYRVVTKWWERRKLKNKIRESFDKWAVSIDQLHQDRRKGAKVAIPVVRLKGEKP